MPEQRRQRQAPTGGASTADRTERQRAGTEGAIVQVFAEQNAYRVELFEAPGHTIGLVDASADDSSPPPHRSTDAPLLAPYLLHERVQRVPERAPGDRRRLLRRLVERERAGARANAAAERGSASETKHATVPARGARTPHPTGVV